MLSDLNIQVHLYTAHILFHHRNITSEIRLEINQTYLSTLKKKLQVDSDL